MANKKKSNVVKKGTTKKVLNEFDDTKKKTIKKTASKKNTSTKKNNNKQVKVEPVVVEKQNNFHEKLQSFVSILFTIVIFVLLIFLIFVIYNNYLKPKMKINKEEVCEEYIKKDYKINKDNVLNFIKNNRHIIYNINSFDRDNIRNEDILNIAKFIIWNTEGEYIRCDENDDERCLVTKKEMYYSNIMSDIDDFLQFDDLSLTIPEDLDDKIRLYEQDQKLVLTFSEFQYETYKHDVVDIIIDEDIINIYYALSERIPSTDYYNYVGSKIVTLKYLNKDSFYLDKIKTNIIE